MDYNFEITEIFQFIPPKGKWNLRVLTDKGYVYHQTKGNNTD